MHLKNSKFRTLKRFLPIIILVQLCSSLLFVSPVLEFEYGVTPELRLRQTYDDNVYFRDESDFETRISPSLAVAAVTDRTELQASASLDISEYADRTELNTVDQFYQLLGGFAVGPRLQLDVTGTYVVDFTFASALEEEGIIADRDKRKRADFRPRATFRLSPRDRLQLTYGLNNTQYEDRNRRDYLNQDLRLAWIHDLKNERTSLEYLVGGSYADFGDRDDSDFDSIDQYTLRGLVGVEHRLTETNTIGIRGGARYTHSKSEERENLGSAAPKHQAHPA